MFSSVPLIREPLSHSLFVLSQVQQHSNVLRFITARFWSQLSGNYPTFTVFANYFIKSWLRWPVTPCGFLWVNERRFSLLKTVTLFNYALTIFIHFLLPFFEYLHDAFLTQFPVFLLMSLLTTKRCPFKRFRREYHK